MNWIFAVLFLIYVYCTAQHIELDFFTEFEGSDYKTCKRFEATT